MPASARTSPVRASSAAMPPKRPAERRRPRPPARRCRSWCARAPPGCGSELASTRPPASSTPPGVPAEPGSKRALEPGLADGRVAREAARVEAGALDRGRRGPTTPAIDAARPPSGELRASGGALAPAPLAVAGQELRARRRDAAAREPLAVAAGRGRSERGLQLDARRRSPGRAGVPADHAEDARAPWSPARRPCRRPRRPAPPTSTRMAWRCAARARRRGGTPAAGSARRERSSSSAYIARKSPRYQASAKSPAARSDAGRRARADDQPDGERERSPAATATGSARDGRRARRSGVKRLTASALDPSPSGRPRLGATLTPGV